MEALKQLFKVALIFSRQEYARDTRTREKIRACSVLVAIFPSFLPAESRRIEIYFSRRLQRFTLCTSSQDLARGCTRWNEREGGSDLVRVAEMHDPNTDACTGVRGLCVPLASTLFEAQSDFKRARRRSRKEVPSPGGCAGQEEMSSIFLILSRPISPPRSPPDDYTRKNDSATSAKSQ